MTITYPMKELRAILRPAEDCTVSEWCDEYRWINQRYSAKPGRWSTAETPYLKEPLDAFTDPHVEAIGFMKCSRVGGTEWVNNLIAYTASERPMPMMYAQPEKDDTVDELRGRIRHIFEDSPRLSSLIPDRNWVHDELLELATCDIYGAWATNPGTMKRKTIGVAFFDEIDNSEAIAGRLGNTLAFLMERTATFGHRGKVIIDGTPTLEEASGWQYLLTSDYRKPFVPCPYCGTYQVMVFGQIKLKPGHRDERDPEKIKIGQLAGYECIECKTLIEHKEHHRWMIDRVVWIASAVKGEDKTPAQWPDERLDVSSEDAKTQAMACGPVSGQSLRGWRQWKPKLGGVAPLTRRRGYWINALYSPWSSRTWSHILAKFMASRGDRETLRVFENSWLGEPSRDAVEKTDIDLLRAKAKNSYPGGEIGRGEIIVPSFVRILLMGADVQGREIHWGIRGWGAWEKSALIAHGICTEWDELYRIAFMTGFRQEVLTADGEVVTNLLRCHALAVDSGHRTAEVYDFARRPGVTAVKGVQNGDYKVKPSKVEYYPDLSPKAQTLEILVVNTTFFKTKIARLAALPSGHRSEWLLPRDTGEDYFQEFCAEHQVRRRVGGKKSKKWATVWEVKTDGARNEAFDWEVYIAALADVVRVPLMREDAATVGVMPAAAAGDAKTQATAGRAKKDEVKARVVPRGWTRR